MAKVLLEYVKSEPKISSKGNSYVRCSIKVKGEWYSGFGDDITTNWRGGKIVNVELYEEEYNGNTQKKFRRIEEEITPEQANYHDLEQRVSNIEKFIKNHSWVKSSPPEDKAEKRLNEIMKEPDLPFDEPPPFPEELTDDDI